MLSLLTFQKVFRSTLCSLSWIGLFKCGKQLLRKSRRDSFSGTQEEGWTVNAASNTGTAEYLMYFCIQTVWLFRRFFWKHSCEMLWFVCKLLQKHPDVLNWTQKYNIGLTTEDCLCVSVFWPLWRVSTNLYLSLHVAVSLFLWMFSGCTPPVYTMSTLRASSSETLMLIDPSEEAWTQVCCRRPWLWHGCRGILGYRGAYRARAESATSRGTSDPVLF